MYVITFYSFKGGVGRTLALVNVGVHLALTGKSVLLVDFDLEAPGLDAFPVLRHKEPKPGIVDFVTNYLRTGEAPSVADYISECEIPGIDRGSVRLMRSGFGDEGYSARLGAINWQHLYERRDGYLLLEDLKAQWEALNPDYVLIDSRTGFTDVGGVCTRQLPDAVAALFIPNEDNVRGMERIAEGVRRERRDPDSAIRLQFVVSNVPRLDDEEGILRRRIRNAGRRLRFPGPVPMIYRYESLALLDNEVFVLKRKKSRLADDYRRLAAAVTAGNYDDRIVALNALQGSGPHDWLAGPMPFDLVSKLTLKHWNDGEILWAASKKATEFGLDQNAVTFRRRAYELGFRDGEMLFALSREAEAAGSIDEQTSLLRTALEQERIDPITLNRIIDSLSRIPSITADEIIASPAFQAHKPAVQARICDQLMSRLDWLPNVDLMLHQLLNVQTEVGDDAIVNRIMLCLVGEGKFEQAMAIVSHRPSDAAEFGVPETFNYAMAEWGHTRKAPVDLFEAVVESVNIDSAPLEKNSCQCLAIAAQRTGRIDTASQLLGKAKTLAAEDRGPSFSGWRYLNVGPEEFDQDLLVLERMLRGEDVVPEVLRRNWNRVADSKE
jgi:MinD-like ATPase involved in chromosome partitioning or flagellar assembly